MRQVSGFAGRNGRYCESRSEAASDILSNRGNGEFTRVINGDILDKEADLIDLRDAIVWVADQVRKKRKSTTKGKA